MGYRCELLGEPLGILLENGDVVWHVLPTMQKGLSWIIEKVVKMVYAWLDQSLGKNPLDEWPCLDCAWEVVED